MFRRRRSSGIGILLLAAQLIQTGLQHIPPVTLGVIALNTAIYLRVFTGLPSVRQACISYIYVWYAKDWKRIFLSPFFHLDDMHLYYNMASFLWKGRTLEPHLGSAGMLYLISAFSVLTSLTVLVLDKCLSVLLNDLSYIHVCAAGFSGVIFALKVVTTYHHPPGMTNVLFFRVPSRIACWVELVVIQLLVPSASFTGHLAGILVGLLYVKGPLKQIMDSVGNLSRPVYPIRPAYTYNSGRSGRRSEQFAADEDADLQAALQESLNEAGQRRRQHNEHNPGASTTHNSSTTRSSSTTPNSSSMTRPSSSTTPTNDSDVSEDSHLTSEELRQRRLRRFQT